MDLNYLSFIDPAFLDIDGSCTDEIEKHLSALPKEDQLGKKKIFIKRFF